MQKTRSKIDMTTGPIMEKIVLFALPIVIGNILQQLYTTVDTLVIGHFCGDTSLAAVGTSSQPVEVLLCIFLGIGTGVSILMSQYIGAGEEDGMRRVCDTAVTFVYLSGIPLILLGWISTPFILRFMGVPADTWDAALTYTRLVFCGSLGNIGYNMNAGILRGMGDSKASLKFLVISCITNIILDLVFVAGLHMDAGGAALSTSISMYISWIVSIVYLQKKFPELEFPTLPRRIFGKEMQAILKIGLPIGLNSSLFSFGHMAMQTLNNAQGSTYMAGCAIAQRITGVTNIAITAFSSACSTFSGQNYGARNFDRLRQGYLKIPITSGLVTLSFGLLFIGVRRPILAFFSDDPLVLMYASRFVFVVLCSQWMFAVFNGLTSFVNGVGKVRFTMVVSLLMLWAVRIPSAYLINRYYDGTYMMVCFPISFFFGMSCMLIYCLTNRGWKKMLRGES